MNQSLLLHVVEKLEGFVGKLPATIQKPILSELTPLKELFLQQRAPRLLFTGSSRTPLSDILLAIFPDVTLEGETDVSIENRWRQVPLAERGTISIMDARMADQSVVADLRHELRAEPADLIFFLEEAGASRPSRKGYLDNLATCLELNDQGRPETKIISLVLPATKTAGNGAGQAESDGEKALVETKGAPLERLAGKFHLNLHRPSPATSGILGAAARALPNEARIEMARLSRDREVQGDIAHLLVKSTTAICTAIGAQPIPLADLPVLTTLQLVMVSGIMYVSGRERSLRAATEFVGALGVNVGAGMLLREGARAVLKFFPGWGNVVCGMVAGAGTYAIGRAATVFFVEGVSLKDARRTYLQSRKKRQTPKLPAPKRRTSGRLRRRSRHPGP